MQGFITQKELYYKGYRPSDAAKVLGLSASHISRVLRGKRVSEKLQTMLLELPSQDLPPIIRKKTSTAK